VRLKTAAFVFSLSTLGLVRVLAPLGARTIVQRVADHCSGAALECAIHFLPRTRQRCRVERHRGRNTKGPPEEFDCSKVSSLPPRDTFEQRLLAVSECDSIADPQMGLLSALQGGVTLPNKKVRYKCATNFRCIWLVAAVDVSTLG